MFLLWISVDIFSRHIASETKWLIIWASFKSEHKDNQRNAQGKTNLQQKIVYKYEKSSKSSFYIDLKLIWIVQKLFVA